MACFLSATPPGVRRVKVVWSAAEPGVVVANSASEGTSSAVTDTFG